MSETPQVRGRGAACRDLEDDDAPDGASPGGVSYLALSVARLDLAGWALS